MPSGAFLFLASRCDKGGTPGGTRTSGLLVRNQTLYPLSYGRAYRTWEYTMRSDAVNLCWRVGRDSNPGYLTVHSLSRRARSTTLAPTHNPGDAGGEGGIRTHGAHHPAVFKTAAIDHSATSPRGSYSMPHSAALRKLGSRRFTTKTRRTRGKHQEETPSIHFVLRSPWCPPCLGGESPLLRRAVARIRCVPCRAGRGGSRRGS